MVSSKRILAIETSGRFGSVATIEGGSDGATPLHQIILPETQRTAQSLAPAIHELLLATDWSPRDVELVAVAVGPGSFTGLRIGVTTAKAFAYAVGAEVVGVDTLHAIAEQAPVACSPAWTIIDAQRQELFAAKFASDGKSEPRRLVDTAIVSQSEWLERLHPGDRVSGPALKRVRPFLPAHIAIVPEELWQPMADAVGKLAWRRYVAGERDDVWKLAPLYLRPSAAEEKRRS